MMIYTARYFKRKGQLKIQQMAFVLVALMIFFAIVAIFYIQIRLGSLRGDAGLLMDESARALVKKLAGTSEFSSNECANCIDLDKVFILKERESYKGFWGDIDFLKVEKLYPNSGADECTRANYPNCGSITVIDKEDFGSASDAFVSLCRWESEKGGYIKCELGRIYASGMGVKK